MATNGADGNVNENTAASNTLKPHGGSTAGDVGKTELLAQVVAMMGGMGQKEINKFSETINQYGKGKFPGAKDVSSSSTKQMTKSAIKEDVAALFEGQEDLTEEFTTKASTLFEAAVNTRVALEMEEIQEQNEELVEAAIAKHIETIEENVEKYLSYIAEQWLDENTIAVEESLQNEAAMAFLENVRELMAESYIEVPEDRVDVVEELEQRLAEMEEAYNEALNEKIELEYNIEEAYKDAVIDDVTEGMVETHVEKFRTMVEDIDFVDTDQYRQKLEIVKENYFDHNEDSDEGTGVVVEETSTSPEALTEELNEGAPSEVDSFVDYIARQSRNTTFTG